MNRFDPPGGRPWGLFGLCGASMLLNVVLGTRLMLSPAAPEAAPMVAEAPEPAAVAHDVMPTPIPVQAIAEEPLEIVEEPAAPAPTATLPADVKTASLDIEHSLARTFGNGIGDAGDEVAAVVARLFVWDLDLRRDLQKGDHVTIAWEGDGPGLQVPAARYESNKLGTLEAFRFQRDGDSWPSWWNREGVEVSRALEDSPIEDYEQITSLLKDRPSHKGMDFKAPEGTPIVSPRAGKVTRTDWNLRYNGNCVEVRYDDGTLARFLHLSQTDVKTGDRVAKGTTIGLSGNTGRSTAPHLHYELEKNGQVVDPIDFHGLVRRTLDGADRARFQADLAELDGWLARADRK